MEETYAEDMEIRKYLEYVQPVSSRRFWTYQQGCPYNLLHLQLPNSSSPPKNKRRTHPFAKRVKINPRKENIHKILFYPCLKFFFFLQNENSIIPTIFFFFKVSREEGNNISFKIEKYGLYKMFSTQNIRYALGACPFL